MSYRSQCSTTFVPQNAARRPTYIFISFVLNGFARRFDQPIWKFAQEPVDPMATVKMGEYGYRAQ